MAGFKPLANIRSFADAQIKASSWKHLQGQSERIWSFSRRSRTSLNTALLHSGLPEGPHLIQEIQTPQHIMAAGLGLGLSNTFADNCEMPGEAYLWRLTRTYDTYCLLSRASTTENDCQHVSNIPKLCQGNSLKAKHSCHGSKAACQYGGCS